MKKTLFLFITLIVVLHAAGSAEKAEKAHPSKTTAVVPIKPVEAQKSQVQPVPAAPKAGEEINWEVISLGGTDGSSASYQLGGTVTQTAIGPGTSASYGVNSGFWQEFGETFVCGDVNNDGIINVGDIVYLLNYLYKQPWPDPVPYPCVGDVNNDDVVELGDIVYLINYVFRAGPPPDPNCCAPLWANE